MTKKGREGYSSDEYEKKVIGEKWLMDESKVELIVSDNFVQETWFVDGRTELNEPISQDVQQGETTIIVV